METVKRIWNKFKYGTGLFISILYIGYDLLFKNVNIATTSTAMQLEDSDASYAVGMALANSGNSLVPFIIALALFAFCWYNLFIKTEK